MSTYIISDAKISGLIGALNKQILKDPPNDGELFETVVWLSANFLSQSPPELLENYIQSFNEYLRIKLAEIYAEKDLLQ